MFYSLPFRIINTLLFMIVPTALLLSVCKNRPAKIALMTFGAAYLLYVSIWLPMLFGIYSDAFRYIYKAVVFVQNLLIIYCFSLFMQNKRLSAATRSWINLLWVFSAAVLSGVFDFVWNANMLPVYIPQEGQININNLFNVVVCAIMAVAYYVFARSGSFTANDEIKDLSPLNANVIKALAVCCLLVLALWIYFKYAAQPLLNL